MSQSSAQRRRSALIAALPPLPYRPMVDQAVAESKGTQVSRLQRDVYLAFEKTIPLIGTRPETNEALAWLAGAEYVLRRLRTEIVIGE